MTSERMMRNVIYLRVKFTAAKYERFINYEARKI